MRKIKLRAWVIDEKFMAEVGRWINNGRVGIYIQDSGPFLMQPDDIVLMQYTGLKDKHGKEIYEGDIVQKPAHNSEQVFNYVVVWKNEWACYFMAILKSTLGYLNSYPSTDSGEEFAHYTAPYGEVIGNIYENPELMGNK